MEDPPEFDAQMHGSKARGQPVQLGPLPMSVVEEIMRARCAWWIVHGGLCMVAWLPGGMLTVHVLDNLFCSWMRKGLGPLHYTML